MSTDDLARGGRMEELRVAEAEARSKEALAAGVAPLVMVCLVCWGNPYPVIEMPFEDRAVAVRKSDGSEHIVMRRFPAGMNAQGFVPGGYDCHSTFVTRVGGGMDYFPAPPREWDGSGSGTYSELVVEQRAPVLPLAVLRFM